jgi:predicted DNA-binding protein
MLDHDAAKRNSLPAERRAKSGEKREGADSQNGGHFAAQAEPAPAPARGSRALAGATHRDRKARSARPALRPGKRSEKYRWRMTAEEMQRLKDVSAQTGINRSHLIRKAVRELLTGTVHLLEREQLAALEVARQLRLIGINLNQIAKRLNQLAGDRDTLERVQRDVQKVHAEVMEAEDHWRGLVVMARNRIVPEYGRD